jgi:peptide/nickel transport system permease protein
MAARFLMAGRISLLVGFFAMLLSTLLGTLVGVIAGYRGGWVNAALMRIVDGFLSFPSIFLLLALAVALKPSPVMITVIIALTSWMEVARIVEAEVRSLKEREFVQAGRMLGLGGAHIMFREILPNAMGPIIVAATLTVARAILLEAYISFLGYGIQPPLPSWGNMLNGAQQYLASAPWLAIIPGIAITIAVTSFNFIGDGLRDALDVRRPHLRVSPRFRLSTARSATRWKKPGSRTRTRPSGGRRHRSGRCRGSRWRKSSTWPSSARVMPGCRRGWCWRAKGGRLRPSTR